MTQNKPTKAPGYHISFDVEKGGKAINVIQVQLERVLYREADNVQFNVALCDDPLYPALVDYILSNPPRTPKR